MISHITFWHEYYAKNLKAEAKGKKYLFPKIKYSILSEQGVDSLKKCSEKELFERLTKANKQIEKRILEDNVTNMTYREGSKPYKILDFVNMINGHIQSHTRAIKKTQKLHMFLNTQI